MAYLAATTATLSLALIFFLPPLRLRFVRRLYPRRMADAVYAGAAEIVFYVQAELDKLLMLALAGERIAGLYAIAMRVIDLTAMPVRSFNQMLVQKIMKDRGFAGGAGRLALVEAGIATISIGGLLAVIIALWPFPGCWAGTSAKRPISSCRCSWSRPSAIWSNTMPSCSMRASGPARGSRSCWRSPG